MNRTRINLAIGRRYIAQMYLLLGDVERALVMFEEIMDQQPAFSLTSGMLAQGYLINGQFDRAEFFAKYSLGGSAYHLAYDALIRSYIYRGDFENALRFASKMELNDDLNYFYHFFAGWLALSEDELEDAEEHFQEYYKKTPCVRVDYSRLGFMRAVELFMELYEENDEALPDDEEIEEVAWDLLDREEYEHSAAYYTLLSMKHPLEPVYHFQLGYIYEEMDLRLDAIYEYSLYLQMEPDAEDGEAIREYIVSQKVQDEI